MKSGLVFKLWLTITALVMGGLLILGISVARQMEGLYEFHLSEHMVGQARGLIDLYDPDPESPAPTPWKALETVFGAKITTLTNSDLEVLARGETAVIHLPPAMARRIQAGETVAFRDPKGALPISAHHGTTTGGGEYEVFVTGVPLLREGNVHGALVLSAPFTSVARTVTRFRLMLAGTAAATLAGVTLLALFLSRRLSRPLLEMNSMAQAMAAGDFRQRVEVVGQDEVGRLGESINSLASALAATIRQLGDEGARLAGILSSMSDGVILADLNRQVTLLNPPAAHLIRQAGLDCSATPCTADWGCLEVLGIGPLIRQAMAESRPLEQRVPLGGAVYSVHLAPVQDEYGSAHGAVAVWQDITREERLEEMRRDFVANVSHEMRTPISLVRGYVEALQDNMDESAAEHEEILAIIGDEMDRLERLVTELLELARLDAGQVRLELEPVALGPLMEYMVRKLAPLTEQAKAAITPEIPANLPPALADTDRLEQVLLNLLDNALRHSPAGSTVGVSAQAEGDRITVRIRDFGPGVPPAEHHLVWERFYRGDRARSRKKGGTGLGLAIVRGLVTAHAGQVWVENPPGGGSAFCFTLPLAELRQPMG